MSRSRKSWPKAVIDRVLELRKVSGHNWKEISRKTEVPYFTVLSWSHQRKAAFVDGGEFKAVTVATPSSKWASENGESCQEVATITIMIGNRVRIEGLRNCDVAPLLRRLKL